MTWLQRLLPAWIAGLLAVGLTVAASGAPPAASAATPGAITPTTASAAPAPAAEQVAADQTPLDTAPAPDPTTTLAPPPPGSNGVAETWAVVIGADDYHGLDQRLTAGIADATATRDALEQVFGVTAAHRRVLLGDDATGPAVRAAIEWLVTEAGPEDRAVLFYAGHIRSDGGDRQWFFLPDGSSVHDHELAGWLDGLRAQQVWLPIAGCFAAGFDELLAPGRVLTAASARDDLAYENTGLGHSYLVHGMIVDGLLGGNATTVEDAFAHAVAVLSTEFSHRLPLQFDQLAGTFGSAN